MSVLTVIGIVVISLGGLGFIVSVYKTFASDDVEGTKWLLWCCVTILVVIVGLVPYMAGETPPQECPVHETTWDAYPGHNGKIECPAGDVWFLIDGKHYTMVEWTGEEAP